MMGDIRRTFHRITFTKLRGVTCLRTLKCIARRESPKVPTIANAWNKETHHYLDPEFSHLAWTFSYSASIAIANNPLTQVGEMDTTLTTAEGHMKKRLGISIGRRRALIEPWQRAPST
jgi:hypothetical protein